MKTRTSRTSTIAVALALSLGPVSAAGAASAVMAAVETAPYINTDTPESLHNYLHYKQEALRLHADYCKALNKDGGQLSAADDRKLSARLESFNSRLNALTSDDDNGHKRSGSNLSVTRIVSSNFPTPFALDVPARSASLTNCS